MTGEAVSTTTAPTGRPWAKDVAALALVLAAPVAIALLGTPGPVSATLKLGPNAGAYLSGMKPLYEIDGLQAARWTSYDASVDLPVIATGPTDVAYRFSRVLGQTAVVDVSLGGHPLDHFTCRGGGYLVRRPGPFELPRTPGTLRFQVDSHDPQKLGLKLDWVRVGVGAGGRLRLRGAAAWAPALLLAGLFASFRFGGLGPLAALGASLPWALAAAAWGWADPFALAHVASRIALPCVVLTAVVALVVRRMPGGSWVVVLFAAGYLIKGAGLFHPTSFYPDFQNARRYIVALAGAEGSLAERGLAAQVATNVGYPRSVGGKEYAFPYAPLFFIPFGLVAQGEEIEDAFRQVGLACAALEIVPVFLLAGLLFRGSSTRRTTMPGLAAAAVSIVLPPLYSRLLLAMTVTLAGHLLDAFLILATLAFLAEPQDRRWRLAVPLLALASLLTYVTSLFTVGAFLLAVALVERRHALRLLLVLGVSGLVTVAWLYGPFVKVFFAEILPAVLHGAAGPGGTASTSAAWIALGRIPLFYGPAIPLLAVGGALLLRGHIAQPLGRGLFAYALAFAALVGLRAFGGGLFRDLKEITFAAPLVAVTTGVLIEAIAAQGRAGRLAAGVLALGLAVFGMGRYRDYLQTYASPFLAVTDARPAQE